jgi:hypothetical protein
MSERSATRRQEEDFQRRKDLERIGASIRGRSATTQYNKPEGREYAEYRAFHVPGSTEYERRIEFEAKNPRPSLPDNPIGDIWRWLTGRKKTEPTLSSINSSNPVPIPKASVTGLAKLAAPTAPTSVNPAATPSTKVAPAATTIHTNERLVHSDPEAQVILDGLAADIEMFRRLKERYQEEAAATGRIKTGKTATIVNRAFPTSRKEIKF